MYEKTSWLPPLGYICKGGLGAWGVGGGELEGGDGRSAKGGGSAIVVIILGMREGRWYNQGGGVKQKGRKSNVSGAGDCRPHFRQEKKKPQRPSRRGVGGMQRGDLFYRRPEESLQRAAHAADGGKDATKKKSPCRRSTR